MDNGWIAPVGLCGTLGYLTYIGSSYYVQKEISGRAGVLLEEKGYSVEDMATEQLLSFLKTQDIHLTRDELLAYQKEYNSLTESEKERFLRKHAKIPLYLPVGIVGLYLGLFVLIQTKISG